MITLTRPQLSALKWLRNRDGDGIFDKTHVLCARGERAGVMRTTWNALAGAGAIEFYADRKRARVTEYGRSVDVSQVWESDCAEVEA